jgi:hypothetical protein
VCEGLRDLAARLQAGERTRDTTRAHREERARAARQSRHDIKVSTSVDDVSTAPLCGRDAATRGAEFEAGRRGGDAEFEGGGAEQTSVHVPSRLHLVTVITSQDARRPSQDGEPSRDRF